MTLTVRNSSLFFSTLSSMMLEEPIPNYVFDQFAFKQIDFNATKGDTVYLNRYPYFGDVGLTLTARQLTETTTIGTSDPVNQDVNSVAVTLAEYAGPYSSAASKVSPLGITEKVARQAQEVLIDTNDPLDFFNSIGGRSLKDDHDRFHDRVLCNLMLTTTNKRNPDGVADGSTATTSTGSTFDTADLLSIKETLQNNFAPTFEDGMYWAVLSPRMQKHLALDSDFRNAMYYADPMSRLRGEIAQYEGFRFFGSLNMPTATINSLTAYKGLFFGAGSVGYGEGMEPVAIRRNKNDDFERFMYLIWLVFRGYALLDGRFVVEGRTFAA